jgi:hypothetical protein
MKPATVTAFLVALLVSLAMSRTGVAEGPYWPVSWQHAYVLTDSQDVTVTYVERSGCRDQKIELSLTSKWNLDPMGIRALAIANAVTLLGNNGYELVGEGHAYCHASDRRAIHFKRGRH